MHSGVGAAQRGNTWRMFGVEALGTKREQLETEAATKNHHLAIEIQISLFFDLDASVEPLWIPC
jgi:hypothetical protein